jgi:hypothetical protein
MKRIVLAVVALLLPAGAATAAQAATTIAPPPGVQVSGMTYLPGAHVPATHLPPVTPVNGTLQSSNWSGYADLTCGTCAVRYVAVSFRLPSVNCAKSPDGSAVAFFAGLDGIGDTTVEQIGATVLCSGGKASYLAFYEMFPLNPVAFSGVHPGDAISVSVYFNAATKHWQLALADVTNGGKIAASKTCPAGSTCRNRSAEVITEAPSDSSGTVLPLADFGQASYTGIQVTSRNGTHGAMVSNGLWTTDALDMLGSAGNTLAAPGPVQSGGRAFQDTWHAAS